MKRMKNHLRLIKVVRSKVRGKKWTAVFSRNGRRVVRHFGQRGAEDYTMHKDRERRFQYVRRHMKDLRTKDPTRAGYLSMFLLWGRSTSLRQQIKRFRSLLLTYNRTGTFPLTDARTILRDGIESRRRRNAHSVRV